MKSIFAIAINTFREAVRNRILYIILIFALLILSSSSIVKNLSIGDHDRVMRDFGLAAISFFGLAVAILVGINLVYNELDKKSIYTIVSKPIDRWQFLLGKYFGLLLTIYVNILIMAVFFLGMIHFQERMSDAVLYKVLALENGDLRDHQALLYFGHALSSIFVALWHGLINLFGGRGIPQTAYISTVVALIMMELAVVTAFAILYSSFSTPTLSAILTVLTLVIGRMNESIWLYMQKLQNEGGFSGVAGGIKYLFAKVALYATPNLGAFREYTLALNTNQPLAMHWWTLAYGFVYAGFILCVSIMIFRSRNFK